MGLIVSPTGKMVVIDNVQKENEWLNSGFRRATDEEEREYMEERRALILKMENADDVKRGIYFATVSQGGKDGYGVASAGIMKELEKLGVPISTHYSGQKVAILFHNPYSLPRIEAPYRIIYTMFESDKIPDDWIDYLQASDDVVVPSKWCADVFEKSGITAKVVPLGYDSGVFKFHRRDIPRKTRRNFVFLHYNAFNIRKGFPEVFKAFTQEFSKDEPVKLILKTVYNSSPLPITKSEYPNIDIVYGKYSETQLAELCNSADCFVFPSRGEGFGITPLEAMATGASAIVPNAHGITEYFNPEYMYEVEVESMCPALYTKYKNQDVGKMVVCDIKDLRKKMRWVYEHQEENLLMGEKASEYVKKWTIENTAKNLKAIIDEAMLKPVEPNRLKNVLTLELVR